MNSIKAICFDLDGVYFTPKGKQSFHSALIEEFGASKESVDAFMYKSYEMLSFMLGKISPSEFFGFLRQATGITATNDELATRWARDYEVDEGVRSVIYKLRERGYQACVCTNNNEARIDLLEEKFHFLKDFDVIVSSHQVGHVKPSKEIFETLLMKAKVEPNELVYADDNPSRLEGAKELGIQTFVYENFNQFLEELKERGVNLK